jgi:hypothetical protein
LSYKENFKLIDWTKKRPATTMVVEPHEIQRSHFATPMIAGDYEAYECPVSGKMIEGRKAHEENLKATGCRILERGEKEDNVRNATLAAKEEDKRRDAAIDGIVDQVAKDFF